MAFEARYDKETPEVQEMAKRIAADGVQCFETTEAFVERYGKEAAAMISRGGLLAALWEQGMNVIPARLEGEARDQPRGLHIRPLA